MVSIGENLDGKYVVVGRLGGGGFGEVFLAEDEAIPGRQLALKVLSRNSAGNHDDLIWEMRTLAKLNLPGIVSFFHHFTHDKQIVLVMEYCAGGSLYHRLTAGGAIARNDVFRWGEVLCDTLAFVHGKGIVYHDIKPANILFSHDGAIKLGDFGVANRHAGTRLYMPPEMLLGGFGSRTDPRVDVYALGLTLLQMLIGAHPLESMSSDDALKARMAHDFVPDDLPRWVQEIILRATHPTPELRFQNMTDFREAIEGKHVPYVFDSNRIKAHALAEKSESQAAKKKWKAAENLATQALRLSPDCAPALVAAGRYEAGDDLARDVMKEESANDCFRNNRFLCRLLSDGYSARQLDEIAADTIDNPFIAHNLAVAREKPRSWTEGGTPTLRAKLIFQEYRFGQALASRKTNEISIRLPDGNRSETSAPLVSIGSFATNDITLTDSSVSRRHAVIVNFPHEVWLYDLGSTCGTRLDQDSVGGRVFLDGVHRIGIGRTTLEVGARADLLV